MCTSVEETVAKQSTADKEKTSAPSEIYSQRKCRLYKDRAVTCETFEDSCRVSERSQCVLW